MNATEQQSKKKYELVIFDWDGTLMDSAGIIVDCVQKASVDLGLPKPSDYQARHIIGLGLKEAMQFLFPESNDHTWQQMAERYRYYYLTQDHTIPLFKGAFDLIAELECRNVLAIATGKSRKGLDRVLESTGLQSFFKFTRTVDETFSKPDPTMIFELMEDTGISPENTVMIGDTTHDLQMAINAKVDGIGVAYGAHPVEELQRCNPVFIANNVQELRSYLI